MNMFDLACELHVQIFTRLCSVVAKLYQNGFKPFQPSGKFFLFLFFIHLFTILMFFILSTEYHLVKPQRQGQGSLGTDNDNVNAQKKEAEIGLDDVFPQRKDVIASSTCRTVSAQAASHGQRRQPQVTFGFSPLGSQEYKGGRNRPL